MSFSGMGVIVEVENLHHDQLGLYCLKVTFLSLSIHTVWKSRDVFFDLLLRGETVVLGDEGTSFSQ
jgi:hypothetical protein